MTVTALVQSIVGFLGALVTTANSRCAHCQYFTMAHRLITTVCAVGAVQGLRLCESGGDDEAIGTEMYIK